MSQREVQDQREILVIDDEPSVLYTTMLDLGESGFRVRGFDDPLEALMWASDVEATCLIVDLKIPGIEGLDLVSAFCALNRHAVILVSGFIGSATRSTPCGWAWTTCFSNLQRPRN